MKRRVTIKDVAREAGVSTALVSMVMHASFDKDGNPDCKVRKETARKVLEVIDRMGYIPSGAAAQISNGRSGNIAVITSDIASNFFSEICHHIEQRALERGYNAIFASTADKADRLERVIYSMIRLGVDGMIIVPPSVEVKALKALEGRNIPVVFLERDIPAYAEAGRVVLDNAEACRLAVDELYGAGYKKIGMISYKLDISTLHEKEEGYRRYMAELGLEDECCLMKVSHDISVEELQPVLRKAVEQGIEALFLPTNRLTMKVMMAASRMGLSIPGQIALVGFDSNRFYELLSPTVSYIYQSTEELGMRSFDMLTEMIENGVPARLEYLQPSLVRGGSSAPKM